MTRRLAGLGLRLFGRVVAGLLRLLGATWRLEIRGEDPRTRSREPQLAALLHQSLVVTAWLFRDRGYGVAVSRSRDGDLVASCLLALGYAEPARGSSSRGGGAVLVSLLRQLEAGTTVAVLVDGPRGPAGVAKPGIAALARLAGRPIQPVAMTAYPALRLGSWDRTLVPLPFARVVCGFGAPIAGDDEEAVRESVERALAALQRQVESRS